MNNLANAYAQRVWGDQVQNIEAAIQSYAQSLEIYTPDAYPHDCCRTARLLANLYADQSRWDESKTTYANALTAAENLYQSALSKGSQEAELAATNGLYRRAAYAYAKAGDLPTAVATIEQGRARSLSETLQRNRADLEAVRQINPDLVERYQTAANTRSQLESTERRTSSDSNQPRYSGAEFRQQTTQARQALQACLIEIRQIPGYKTFLTLPTSQDVAKAVQPGQPLVYLLHTPNGSLALVLSQPSEGITITPLWLNDLTDAKLVELISNTWFTTYGHAKDNRQGWFNAIEQVTQQLWERLIAFVADHLQRHQLPHATLIPTGLLSFVPLHAAWTADHTSPTGRCYALDLIHFTYTPNAQALTAARAIAACTPATKLLAINDPQPVNANPLPSSIIETAKATATFPGQGKWKLLEHEAASRTAVLEALPHYPVVHFSCHGFADFQTPLNSGLLMANNETLSLRDLLDLKLQGLRLAILSACETGIPGTKVPDEVINLPSGLLQAGAAGIVVSLWAVDDRSTMLLLSKFYELWRTENTEPSEALRQAQIWLRDSTEVEIAPLLGKRPRNPTNRPFSHPYYWAAFSYTGV